MDEVIVEECNKSITIVSDRATGAITKNQDDPHHSPDLYSEKVKQIRKDQSSDHFRKYPKQTRTDHSSSQTQIIVNPNLGRVPKRINNRRQQANDGRLRGIRKGSDSSAFKAVKRTVDVFLGRVDRDTNTEIIHDYIKDNFNVTCVKIEKLQIKTELYDAFKITVSLSDRDVLFNRDLWPEDVVISKFYNRNKNNYRKENGD